MVATVPPSTPSNPASWKKFFGSRLITGVPNSYSESSAVDKANGLFTLRDLYVDLAAVLPKEISITQIYADVIALPSLDFEPSEDKSSDGKPPEGSKIVLPQHASLALFARVLTANAEVAITIEPPEIGEAAIIIHASESDQPIKFKVAEQSDISLKFGLDPTVIGYEISFKDKAVSITTVKEHIPLESDVPEKYHMLLTQLRIASLLFWTTPLMTINITKHVGIASGNSQLGTPLQMQARALSQQLALANGGDQIKFAPTLTLDKYEKTLDATLRTALAFEQRYHEFTTIKKDVQLQKATWSAMLGHAEDALSVQSKLTNDAKAKFDAASGTLNKAIWSLRYHESTINEKKKYFEAGVENWKREQKVKAAAAIIFAVVEIAFAIGAMCAGNPGPAAKAPEAVTDAVAAAQAAAETAGKLAKMFNKDNIKKLKDSLDQLNKVWKTTQDVIGILGKAHSNITPKFPVDPSNAPPVDTSGLFELAAWDGWVLDIEDQMNWAVEQKIGGAAAYKTELKKHALNGKIVTQARSEAIKAGQEYCQACYALWLSTRDLKRAQDLLATFNGEIETAQEAQTLFYDRMMLMKTNVLIELRDATWAYEYLSLEQSTISLDPARDLLDLQADKTQIILDVKAWQTKLAKSFASYNESQMASDLKFAGQDIIQGLKNGVTVSDVAQHKVTFTMVPHIVKGADTDPFYGASHVRTKGLRVYLIGIKPKDIKRRTVELQLTPSGIFQDAIGGKVFSFRMDSDARVFSYDINREGKTDGEDGEGAIRIDSFSTDSTTFADSTPFSQWTIELLQPENFDLSELTDVKLVWKGNALYDSRHIPRKDD